MPIYVYRCDACGHQEEFLQKVSDAPRMRCSNCGKDALSKMVTAAGARASFVEIESDKGHDAFLLDEPVLRAGLKGFLDSAALAWEQA